MTRLHSVCGLAAAMLLFCSGATLAAEPAVTRHEHSHHGGPAKLTLDNGRKWRIDEPLRKAMANIRNTLADSLDAIHDGKLPPAKYGELARKIGGEVEYMVGNCKLDPKADAQLHLIIAEILQGVEAMEGKSKKMKRRDGAVKVIGALEKYAVYFDDSGWKPLDH